MISAHERRWVRDACLVAMTLFAVLSIVVYSVLQSAHASLDGRHAKVSALRSLQQSCESGVMPSASELHAVAALFPGCRLTCSRIDDAIYLTFVDDALPAGLGPLVMQGR